MTKARDLANSAAAFASVSATELGYVDGVTSAIQTQIDAKAPSSTAATLTGTQTLTNKTLTSPALTTPTISTATTNGDILYGTGSGALSRLGIGSTNQTLGVTGGVPVYQASSKSTLTTTGDIMYASAANTPARLGIGASATVLTVASGIPSWVAPASGAFVFIKRVAFSAVTSTTTSFDSVFSSTYKAYKIVFESYTGTATTVLNFQLRVGSTTQASTSWRGNYYGYAKNGALINNGNDATTLQPINDHTAGSHQCGFLDVYRVGNTSEIPFFGGLMLNTYSHVQYNSYGDYSTSITADGFLLSTPAGTITGTVAVYGLATA